MKRYPNKNQKEKLEISLAKMPENFIAELCGICNGAGEYKQMYTAGCGGGYYHSVGMCDHCEGEGLTVNGEVASESVINQVNCATET